MICIILPGLLEVPTSRGGAREEQHYNIGLYLSKYFRIIIISPFHGYYEKKRMVNNNFRIERVYFPSCKRYPPSSLAERFLEIFSLCFYSILVSFRVIRLAKEVKMIIVTDILTGALPAIIAKILGIKVVYSEGNLTPWVNPHIFSKELSLIQKILYTFENISGKIIIKLSQAVRVQSSIIKEGMIKNRLNVGKVTVIGPGINTDMKSSNEVNYKDPKIGFIGRLSDEKGAPLLIKICEKLEKRLPKVKFKILGDGPYRKHFQHLKNIEYIGWVDRGNIPKFLSDVHILLFFQKDLGIGEIEALSLGKIIIAPNIGAIPQIIRYGENGFLASPTIDSFVNEIEKVLGLESLILKTVSKNARKTISNLFSWEIVGERWKSFIYDVLESGSKKTLQ